MNRIINLNGVMIELNRGLKPHTTVRNLCRKERGFTMLTRSLSLRVY